MKILGVIPARYASTRFVGKPLIDIGGKSMIQRVYEQALKCPSLDSIMVATDDERIVQNVKNFGGNVMMTSPDHKSGTDRCAEVVAMLNIEAATRSEKVFEKTQLKRVKPFDAVINIQGDEPFIDPKNIEKVIEILSKRLLSERGDIGGEIATLVKLIDNQQDIENPNVVKVVFSTAGNALYFSRSPIPFIRNQTPLPKESIEQYKAEKPKDYYRHIGLYGFRTQTLLALAKLPPSRLENLEALEQLRWLEAGYPIGIGITEFETIGIDTPEDLEKIKHLI